MSELIQSDKPATAEYWARRISYELQKSVESILAAGGELIDAKAACEHGEFCRMFNDHDDPIENHLPISRKTAFCLMSIAECGPLLNVQHAGHLPTSWTTLYELSRLPEMDLEDAIESGRVTPELKRSDVRKLIACDEEKPPSPPVSPKVILMEKIGDTREALREMVIKFDEQPEVLIAILADELEVLREESPEVADLSVATPPVQKKLPEMVAGFQRSKNKANDLRIFFDRLDHPHKVLMAEWLGVPPPRRKLVELEEEFEEVVAAAITAATTRSELNDIVSSLESIGEIVEEQTAVADKKWETAEDDE